MDGAGMQSLLAARRALQSSIDRSRSLAESLASATPRLAEIESRLPTLAAAVRPMRADPSALAAVSAHIDRAVGPAAAVLRVFDAVHGLEPSLLSDPRLDLPGYLAVLARLEEALRFLSDNTGLAVTWLDDILDYLDDHSLADKHFLENLKHSLSALHPPLHGGLLPTALDKLESEFRRLLSDNSTPLPMTDPLSPSSAATIAPSQLPANVVRSLLAILDRMIANDRLDRCLTTYIDVRGTNVRASLNALGLEYLDITQFDDVQSIEPQIDKWGQHLEFAVKHLFEAEYKLCGEVFDRAGPAEVWVGCFAEIAAQAGMLAFLRFGLTVSESKKDPIKLLKLLDIFATLSRLRLDFNRLFGGKACAEIQNLTRDLIKRVIEGACEIFWELLVQVELKRQAPPPADGAVPKLVSFVTDYCNRLMSEDYMPVLTQVLIIQRSWKQERFNERLLTDAVLNIVKALEANFEAWSKGYEDIILSYIFMMNTHWHFFKHLKGTKVGELLGDVWLREHEQYKDYYAAMYLRESWGKLPALLSREGLILFSGGRATARDLVKKRLKAFNETFDEMYQKHSNWVITDEDLREKMCHMVVQTIVPVYRSYMQNYGALVEQDASASKYAKYTAQTLETMVGSLFQHKPGRSLSFRPRHSNGKANNAITRQYSSPATIM